MVKVNTNKTQLDINYIHQILNNTYWAEGRTIEQVKKSIDNSICFGVYLDQRQIGFARVVTDKVIFSYLMDVFIDEEYQGKGYGQLLISEIYNHIDLKHVNKHYLHTKDAQKFYLKFGFEVYGLPERFMVKIFT